VITAVDSNVLIDVLSADPAFGPGSRSALRRARDTGSLIVCDVVWSEVIGAFSDRGAGEAALERLRIAYSELDRSAATRAGVAWREYRQRAGTRERLVADFLVGAHALEQADQLLTRDRGFQRVAFEGLRIIDPTHS
jgi:predicted nucleic acid-binding protein